MVCKNCGNEIKANEKFCRKCGNQISNQENGLRLSNTAKKTIVNISCIVIFFTIILGISISVNNKKPIDVATQVETEEQKQERLKRQEENNKISKAIEDFGEIVRNSNQGDVKYSSYSTYKTTSDGTKIYKVKYNTSYSNNEYSRIYYYQFVSLNDSNTEVLKSTKLYRFKELEMPNGQIKTYGDTYSMEYEAEVIWNL